MFKGGMVKRLIKHRNHVVKYQTTFLLHLTTEQYTEWPRAWKVAKQVDIKVSVYTPDISDSRTVLWPTLSDQVHWGQSSQPMVRFWKSYTICLWYHLHKSPKDKDCARLKWKSKNCTYRYTSYIFINLTYFFLFCFYFI